VAGGSEGRAKGPRSESSSGRRGGSSTSTGFGTEQQQQQQQQQQRRRRDRRAGSTSTTTAKRQIAGASAAGHDRVPRGYPPLLSYRGTDSHFGRRRGKAGEALTSLRPLRAACAGGAAVPACAPAPARRAAMRRAYAPRRPVEGCLQRAPAEVSAPKCIGYTWALCQNQPSTTGRPRLQWLLTPFRQ